MATNLVVCWISSWYHQEWKSLTGNSYKLLNLAIESGIEKAILCACLSESHGGLVSAAYGEDDVSRVEEADEKPSENEDSDDDSSRNSVSLNHNFQFRGFLEVSDIHMECNSQIHIFNGPSTNQRRSEPIVI